MFTKAPCTYVCSAESNQEPESENIDEDHPRKPAKKQQERHQTYDHEELKWVPTFLEA